MTKDTYIYATNLVVFLEQGGQEEITVIAQFHRATFGHVQAGKHAITVRKANDPHVERLAERRYTCPPLAEGRGTEITAKGRVYLVPTEAQRGKTVAVFAPPPPPQACKQLV